MNRNDGGDGCWAMIMVAISLFCAAVLFISGSARTEIDKAKYNDIISSANDNISIVIPVWRLEDIILPQGIECEPLSDSKVRISGPKQLVADVFAKSLGLKVE